MATKKTAQAQNTVNSKLITLKQESKQNNTITDDQLEQLEQLFFMGGITPYQASRMVGIHHVTAKKYFDDWAEKLTDDPQHETWVTKEKKYRARALEGLTKQIFPIKTTIENFTKILDALLIPKDKKGTPTKNPQLDLELIERIVRMNRVYFSELQQQYSAIELAPPAEAVLERELEKLIAQKQNLSAVTN